MSDIDLAVRRSKRLETKLRENYRVDGRGLHELVDAAKAKNALPNPLVRKLRLVATVRNKIVHDADYTKIEDRPQFIETCDEAERELDELAGPRDTWRTTFIVVGCLVGLIIAGTILSIGALRDHGVPLW